MADPARISQQVVEVLSNDDSLPLRVSQQVAEVLSNDASLPLRVSQQVVEVLYTPPPDIEAARLDQIVVEAVAQQDAGSVSARLTQQYAQVLLKPFTSVARIDQIVVEAASQQSASSTNARVTQQYAQVLLKPGTTTDLYLNDATDMNLSLSLIL